MVKYIKITDNMFRDYEIYLGRENIYTLLFGHKLGKRAERKANYIYKRLLKLHNKENK